MAARAKLENVALDSFIILGTPYVDLRPRRDDGSWDRYRFAEAHILFPERTKGYDYLATIIRRHGP